MKKLLVIIVLLCAAMVLCAGCVSESDKTPTPTPTPTPAPTAAPSTQTGITGTWYCKNPLTYTDPTYKTLKSYDVAITFNSDNTGIEQWTELTGVKETPFKFTWLKNTDGTYAVFYEKDYRGLGYIPEQYYTLGIDAQTLLDKNANVFTRTLITHSPTATPTPTAVSKYASKSFEDLRGTWTSVETVKSMNNKPCKLVYNFNQPNAEGVGDVIEQWAATDQEGNLFVYEGDWKQATDGSYILTFHKHIAGENYVDEVHVFNFIYSDFSKMIDERGYTYTKSKK